MNMIIQILFNCRSNW